MERDGEPQGGASGEPPPVFSKLSVEAPPEKAAGLKAVTSSLGRVFGKAGLARGIRSLARLNQKGGFDCPSCAWPDPDGDRAAAEFCENGAKALASEADKRRLDAAFFARHPVADLAARSDCWLEAQGRLAEPVVRRPGAPGYEPISWEAAFALLARELNALERADDAVFYTSGRTSNEAAFLYQLFVRQFGTNNLPDCSNMCHESSGLALSETIGVGKGTVTLDDIEHADTLVIIGQNPGTNHPRMLSSLERAARNGADIISVNPLPEVGLRAFAHPQTLKGLLGRATPLASLRLPVRVNGDLPLLKGALKELLEREAERPGSAVDRAFVAAHAEGFERLRESAEAADWADLVEQSGVSIKQIREFAERLRRSKATIFCWAMGLTQHRNAVATIREMVNLQLLRGMVGKPRAGLCPVRGHSNVQGDRTMGIWEKPAPAFLDALQAAIGFEPPRRHGLDTVGAIEAMGERPGMVFFALGGNFLAAAPDTRATARALGRCRLTAHVATKLNRSHLVTGRTGLILPCLGRSEADRQPGGEQFVTVENSMGIVHSSQGRLPPASEALLSEPRLVARLAAATLGERAAVDYEALADDYDRIRDLIEKVVPGFEGFNRRVRQPGGFYLPNPAKERVWKTPGGKARFTVNALDPAPLAPGQLLLMTLRSHDQFNTTVYGEDDRYRGVYGERRVVFLNAEDMAERGIQPGEPIDLESEWEGERRRAPRFKAVPYAIPRGCAAAYFPEANPLVPLRSIARGSRTPASKSVPIRVLKPAAGRG